MTPSEGYRSYSLFVTTGNTFAATKWGGGESIIHPGGGVCGAPGRNAAMVMLRDIGADT